MTVSSTHDAILEVSELVGLTPSELKAIEWPDQQAFFVWQPTRGGIQIAVSRDASVLFAASAINVDVIKRAFESGRRTDPSRFENIRAHNLGSRHD
jgi:hypothetical protein